MAAPDPATTATATAPDGTAIGYAVAGGTDRPTVALVGDAGYGPWQWAWQHAALAGPFRVVTVDLRGVGRSGAPPGPYDLATLADDVRAVLRAIEARAVHLVGAGLGGAVALDLAADGRTRSLSLLGTAAHADGLALERLYADPADPAAVERSLGAALTERFRERHPEAVEDVVGWRTAEDAAPAAWRAQVAALDGVDRRDRLHEITPPALVVHGTADAVWPPARGRALAEGLPRGRHRPVTDAGHLVGVEAARPVNDALVGFLETVADEDGGD